MVTNTAKAELYALTTGVAEGMVTKHLLQELGHEVILMNHVDSQSAKVWASKRRLGRKKHGDAEAHVCARRSGEEVDKSCRHQHKAKQSRSDDKVSHIRSTQERLCDDRIETRLKQNQEVKEQHEDETRRSNARGSQSAVMKK